MRPLVIERLEIERNAITNYELPGHLLRRGMSLFAGRGSAKEHKLIR
jgi:hypothetical protein